MECRGNLFFVHWIISSLVPGIAPPDPGNSFCNSDDGSPLLYRLYHIVTTARNMSTIWRMIESPSPEWVIRREYSLIETNGRYEYFLEMIHDGYYQSWVMVELPDWAYSMSRWSSPLTPSDERPLLSRYPARFHDICWSSALFASRSIDPESTLPDCVDVFAVLPDPTFWYLICLIYSIFVITRFDGAYESDLS